ncbi:3-oxoacyl-[acyl-carrier-protein] synthase-3 [Micromonospora sp. Llam0]|uniref:3-oxoacyl-ACP synthase III family protein n=1 Tax=Micromonospora sp. Llam0 TaxID=2485143 RepID=UPI000F4A3A9E|nr:3-oxoacyl-ACP synthase III family protein [Micromonospora sp. Llam0]ROO52001.1 3-oxoacyl-[acyl-carrier-protein] synthase-3 [Micromonospora sp. Llam0]
MSARILATGSYLPGEPIDNEQLEKLCGPLPADVLAGLGVARRHWLVDPATGEHIISNSRMAEAAARVALAKAGLAPQDVDLIVLSTASPEYHLPTAASYVQEHLGLQRCATIELRAGCVGAVQALDIARRQLADGTFRTALVIGAEAISPLLVPMYQGLDPLGVRMRDRMSLYNFGDGAAAVVLRADPARGTGPERAPGLGACVFGTACLGGGRKPGMRVVGGGTDLPYSRQLARKRLMDIQLDASGVAGLGPQVFVTALRDMLDRTGWQLSDIDAFVLPEGNAEYFSSELAAAGMSRQDHELVQRRVVENLADVAATGSPAVLLALDAGVAQGRIRPGDTVLLLAIEASRYVYAGLSLRWGEPMVAR